MVLGKQRQASHHQSLERHSSRRGRRARRFQSREGGGREGKLCKVTGAAAVGTRASTELRKRPQPNPCSLPRLLVDQSSWWKSQQKSKNKNTPTCGWSMLMYGRGQHKVVQQLFSNLKKKKHQISEVFYITLEYFYLDIFWKFCLVRTQLRFQPANFPPKVSVS